MITRRRPTELDRQWQVVLLIAALPFLAAAVVVFGGVRGAVIAAGMVVSAVVLVRRHAIRVAFETALTLGAFTLTWTALRVRLNLTPSDLLLTFAAMCAVLDWFSGGARPRLPRNLQPLVVYSLLIVVGGLLGGLGAGSSPGAISNAARFGASMIGCGIIAASVTPSSTLRRHVMLAWCAGGAVSAVAGFTGAGIQGRSLGLADHPNHFGFSMLICVAVGAALGADRGAPRWMRAAGLGGSALCSIGLVMSGSRAALVGLVAGFASFLALRYGRRPLALIAIGAAVVVGFVVFPANVEFTPNSAMSRLISPDQSVAASNQARAQRLDDALADISRRPIVGSGFSESRQAHNIVLQLLATAGVFGLLALIAGGNYVVRSVRMAWRVRRGSRGAVSDALAAAVIGVIATMMFSTNLWDRYLLLFFWLGGAWIAHLTSNEVVTATRRPDRTVGSTPT